MMGSIELKDVIAPVQGIRANIPGYAASMAVGTDSRAYHTFEEIQHNSGVADAGNNAVIGRRSAMLQSQISIPAVAPTEAPGKMFRFLPGQAGLPATGGRVKYSALNLPVPVGFETT